MEKYLTAGDVAFLFDVSRLTILSLVKSGEITHFYLNGRKKTLRFEINMLRSWLVSKENIKAAA